MGSSEEDDDSDPRSSLNRELKREDYALPRPDKVENKKKKKFFFSFFPQKAKSNGKLLDAVVDEVKFQYEENEDQHITTEVFFFF